MYETRFHEKEKFWTIDNEMEKKLTKKNSLEVYSRFAFYAEAQVPSSALESRAKVSVAVILVHVEAAKREKEFLVDFCDLKICED